MIRRLSQVALAALACTMVADAAPSVDRVIITSPDSSLRIALYIVDGRLRYDVDRNRIPIIESSPAGILLDGVDLGDVVSMGTVDDYRVGDRANGARVTITHLASRLRYGVELRAYRDGAGLRTIVPGAQPGAEVVPVDRRDALPITVKLPDSSGYATIMESAPQNHVDGRITTPWRIVVVASDPTPPGNSDIVRDLIGPPGR